jgi:CBS domain-containing protein
MQVEHILQGKGRAVHTVRRIAKISEAVALLNQHHIGAVVVVTAGGEVAGILSERDIVRKMGDDPTAFLNTPVEKVMTAKVITCTRDDAITTVMERMTAHRIRHMPIVEPDGVTLCGIVSIGDVVKKKIEETEQEASALREYITH